MIRKHGVRFLKIKNKVTNNNGAGNADEYITLDSGDIEVYGSQVDKQEWEQPLTLLGDSASYVYETSPLTPKPTPAFAAPVPTNSCPPPRKCRRAQP